MAGRGREATLPAWQTVNLGGGPPPFGHQGARPGGSAVPGGAPGGAANWQLHHQGGPPVQVSLQQPWAGVPRVPQGGPPSHGLQRAPHGGGGAALGPPNFQTGARPLGPPGTALLPPGARVDAFRGSAPHVQYSMAQQYGGRPLGQLGQGPGPVAGQQGPPQSYHAQPAPIAPGPVARPMQGLTANMSPAIQPAKPAWTEHSAPDGRKYFYNSITKTSSWTKPAELLQAKGEGPASRVELQCDWKEFTAPDGRKYYYNRQTKQSKWHMPEEMKQAQAAASKSASKPSNVQVLKLKELSHSPSGASPALDSHANGLSMGTPTSARDQGRPGVKQEEDSKSDSYSSLPEPKRPVVYASKEEAKQAFKELLVSVSTTSSSTWEATMRLIVNDPRYEAFRTIGEKKACFNEYLQQRAREEKEESRMQAKKARDDFATLLELSPELKAGIRYSKAAVIFEDEPRWRAVRDARDREQLFNEHMKERERREKEIRRAELKKKKAAFRHLLEKTASIKADSVWRKVQAKLEGEDEFDSLDKLDRLEVFQNHVWELDKEEKVRRERDRLEKFRQERRNRDAFKELLKQHEEKGVILPKMLWKVSSMARVRQEYHELVRDEEALHAIERNIAGSRPRELFEDALERVEDEYCRERASLRDAREAAIAVDTTFETFSSAVQAMQGGQLAEISEANRRVFFDEEVGKLREKVAKEEKRKQRARDDFYYLLRDTRQIDYDTTWSDAKAQLGKEPEYRALGSEEREQIFEEYVAKLAAKREKHKEREKGERKTRKSDDEDRPRKDKKRHKKDKHGDRDKGGERRKDKERQPSGKRRQDDSEGGDEDDRKASKRHKHGQEQEDGGPRADRTSTSPSQPTGRAREGDLRTSEPSPRLERGDSRASEAEDGEL